MLQPVILIAVAILLINDHLLKAVWPGPVSGKLSDIAGLVFFPALIVAAWEVAARRRSFATPTPRAIGMAVVVTGLVFASLKSSPACAQVVAAAVALLQWPFAVLVTSVQGAPAPTIGTPIRLVVDATDLLVLPVLVIPLALGLRRAAAIPGVRALAVTAPPDWWRQLTVGLLATAMYLGAVTDGWAHGHEPAAIETILTPWHAGVYATFALLVVVVLGPSVPRWLGWPASSGARGPDRLAVAGIAIFLAAGLADSAWHVGFGLEVNAEALVSPTHLLLGIGAGMIAGSPLLAMWRMAVPPAWPLLTPVVLGLATLTGLLAFATHLAHPLVDPWPRWAFDAQSPAASTIASVGIASVGLQAAILAAGIVALLRLWRDPPLGALGTVVVLSSAPLLVLHDSLALLPAVLGGAVAAEVAAAWSARRSSLARAALVGASGPGAIWLVELGLLAVAGQVRWSAHLLGGATVIVIVAGALVGILSALPAGPPPSEPAHGPGEPLS